MITRLFDLGILVMLAVAILMPRPDARVKAASGLDDAQRGRVAALEARLLASPGDAEAALEIAGIFVERRRPEWAVAVLHAALERHPNDHRVHARLAVALADHFEAGAAFEASARALALCDTGSVAPCGEAERARLALIESTLRAVRHIDMRKDPNAAKERFLRALRPTYTQKDKLGSTPAP
jgi:hypothetical protein